MIVVEFIIMIRYHDGAFITINTATTAAATAVVIARICICTVIDTTIWIDNGRCG